MSIKDLYVRDREMVREYLEEFICAKLGAMEDLNRRFCAGDPEAVSEVYRRYGGPVLTVARSIVGNNEMAADVVQQTFVKAWRAAHRFDSDRDLAPWLYAIARRTAIDVLRAERQPTRGDHAPEQDVAVTTISFERTWEIFEVRRAIEDLPEVEREVVRLSHLVGLPHSEIAEKLDIAVGTVKSRSHRAHKRLVAALAHMQETPNQMPGRHVQQGEDPA